MSLVKDKNNHSQFKYLAFLGKKLEHLRSLHIFFIHPGHQQSVAGKVTICGVESARDY